MEGVVESTIGGVEKKTVLVVGVVVVIIVILILVWVYSKSKTTSSGSSGSTAQTPKVDTPVAKTMPYSDGSVLRCAETGAIFLVQGGLLRHFTPAGYSAAGNPAFTHVDCSVLASLPVGADL